MIRNPKISVKQNQSNERQQLGQLSTSTGRMTQWSGVIPGPRWRQVRRFTAIDGSHTKSRYRMMLLMARGIDANSEWVPLARSIVPIEDEVLGLGL